MKKMIFAMIMVVGATASAQELFLECRTRGYEERADVDLTERNFILAISENGKKIRYLNNEDVELNTTKDRYQWSKKSASADSGKSASNTLELVEEINRVSGKYRMLLIQRDTSNQIIGKEHFIGRGDCSKIEKKLN